MKKGPHYLILIHCLAGWTRETWYWSLKFSMAFSRAFSGGAISRWQTPLDYENIQLNSGRIDRGLICACLPSAKGLEIWEWPADVVIASTVKAFKSQLEPILNISLDGHQSNVNRMHRSCVFTCVSKSNLLTSVKTAYLIGYRDTSRCPKYIRIIVIISSIWNSSMIQLMRPWFLLSSWIKKINYASAY